VQPPIYLKESQHNQQEEKGEEIMEYMERPIAEEEEKFECDVWGRGHSEPAQITRKAGTPRQGGTMSFEIY